jgi:hypothetical protein
MASNLKLRISKQIYRYTIMKHLKKAVCTTNEFATYFAVTPGSIRKRYWYHGHYFGQIPQKLPNGRLLWSVPDHMKNEIGSDGSVT